MVTNFLEDLDGSAWGTCLQLLSREERFNGSKMFIASEGSSWYRLNFKFDQPMFKILQECTSTEYNESRLQEALQPFRDARARCGMCVDEACSGPWLDRMPSRRTHNVLRHVNALLPMSSVVCEKKHLLGQETHPGKRRGLALKPRRLGVRTYQKSVRDALVRQHKAAYKRLGSLGLNLKAFSKYLCRMSSHRRQSRLGTIGHSASTNACRKTTAFRALKAANWDATVRPCTPAAKQELRRISVAWRTCADRRPYELQAAMDEEECRFAMEQPAVHRSVAAAPSALRRQTRRMLGRALREMQEHPVWSTGAQLSAFGLGLREEKVDVQRTDQAIAARLGSLMGMAMDEGPIPNPTHPPRATGVCAQRFGGLCINEEVTTPVCNALWNLWRLLSAQSIKKDNVPLFIAFSAKEVVLELVVSFMYGKGDFFSGLLVHQLADHHPPAYQCETKRTVHGPVLVDVSLHRMLKKLIEDASAASGCSILEVDIVRFTAFNMMDVVTERRFTFQLGPEVASGVLNTDRRVTQRRRAHAQKKKVDDDALPFGLGNLDKFGGGDHMSNSGDSEETGPDQHDENSIAEIPSEADDTDTADQEHPEPPEPHRRDTEEPPNTLPPGPGGPGAPEEQEVGIVGWDVAPTGRAICLCCGSSIAEGSLRFAYSIRRGPRWRLRRFVHGHCCAGLPAATRRHDFLAVQRMATSPDLSAADRIFFENVADELNPDSGGAQGSGHGPG